MATGNIKINVRLDPIITRMAHHSIAMPEFRKQMADMMKNGKAFITQVEKRGLGVTVHPTDELLDAFYCGMGLK